MANTPYASLTRRGLGLLALATAATPAFAAGKQRIVTMLGDSITAGYGLPSRDAVPAQLEQELNHMGANVRVRAAGVSGDTSAGGLARVDFSVQADSDLCIVALGGNDLLQGLDPRATRGNIDRIIGRLQARHIPVVLAGLRAPPVIGRGYVRDFDGLYPALAAQHRVPLYPNLLAGVMGDRRLLQPDGIHPNAAGAQIIARKLAPTVAQALAARR
ncbi:MAG: arylesterase [Caulobacter sp.]|nr:arylesterase [Caulobacter sp.]